MAELLKDVYNKDFLMELGSNIKSVYPNFNVETFIGEVMDSTWEELKLKERMRRISLKLSVFLPEYKEAIEILLEVNKVSEGFAYLVLPDFVECFGLNYLEVSMSALKEFTKHSSAEFAVRPFIIKYPDRAMEYMREWALDENEHVRRLSSEGIRPRLPWGIGLARFKKDPRPVLEVLEQLKEDNSLYVRKSVANNLNDISKDNPDMVIEIAKKWNGKNKSTDWIIRHGLRTLIKKANKEALELFGYSDKQEYFIKEASINTKEPVVNIGEDCLLSYSLRIETGESIHIRIEYAIDFVKSGNRNSRKIFLFSDKTLIGEQTVTGIKLHSFKDMTTRKHYIGNHKIVLLVNGKEIVETSIILQ